MALRHQHNFVFHLSKAYAIEVARSRCPGMSFSHKMVDQLKLKADVKTKELSEMLNKYRDGKRGKDAVSRATENRLKTALDIKTFVTNVNIREKKVDFKRGGKPIYASIKLDSALNCIKAIRLQNASIYVESIILVLELIGVEIPGSDEVAKQLIEQAENELDKQTSTVEGDIELIKNEKYNHVAMMHNIFHLVIGSYLNGTLWMHLNQVFPALHWKDSSEMTVTIAAYIAKLMVTDGIVHIAELVVELVNTKYFVQKLTNLELLEQIKSELLSNVQNY